MAATVDETPRATTPWWHWVVSVVALLWNGYGGYDYWMSKTAGEAYYRQAGMTDAQIAFMNGYPLWMNVVYAVGIWGGVLGAVLLVVRSRFAVHAFVASLAAFLLSLVYTYGLSGGGKLMSSATVIMQCVVLVGCVFFAWYAWAMAKRGVLR
jgi:hypothetical protein